MVRVFLLLAVLVGLGACQAMPARSRADIERDAETQAYEQLGYMTDTIKENYIKPMTTGHLLALALGGIEGTDVALPSGAHEIVQNSIRAVAAAGSERAQLVAFTQGMGFLSGDQPASTPRLVRAAMTAMAGGLDPHSSYKFTNNAPALANAPEYAAVGLAIKKVGPKTVVVEAFPNTPAALSGIQAGDVLVEIDNQPVEDSDLEGVVNRLRGSVGSQVQLVLRRPSQATPLSLRLIRQLVHLPVLTFSTRDGVALIRPRAYNELTLRRLRDALVDSIAQAGGHLAGLVLDLRNNEGGLLDVITKVTGELLQAGDPVVTLKNRNAEDNQTVQASGGSLPPDMPIIVLVDEGTASGAELMAAALGDSRALLLGSRTFGMGTVQTVIPLRRVAGGTSSGYVRLTTAQMFGPNGQSWQRRGLTPDIPIEPTTGINNKHLEDSLPDALPTPPDIPAPTRPNPLRARLASITPSLLPTPNPPDPTTDFAVEQALRAIALLQPTAAP